MVMPPTPNDRHSLALFTAYYELTMAQAYWQSGQTASATFSLFIRRQPSNRGYLVFAGLDGILDFLDGFHYSAEDIQYLKSLQAFDPAFLEFLRSVRFTGSVRALDEGAEVILAGRASDTSLFAAVPLRMGASPGPSWHAAKILECGAACVTQRKRPDSVSAWIRDGHFIIEPMDPEVRCSPQSVASHTLYENFDPFFITEPGGVIDTSESEYTVE